MNLHDRNRTPGYPYRGGGAERPSGRPDILTSITDAARENPLSAALIGIGAVWLFMGGSNMSLLGGRGRTSIIGAAAQGAGNVATGAAHMASGAAHGVARAGSAVASGVSSAASGLSESVSEGASRVGEYVTGAVHGVDAQSEYRNVDLSGEGNGSGFSHVSHGGYLNRGLSLAKARDNIADLFDRHPLALGLAGLAVGMSVAASLPVTEREREALGKARDAVGDKVAEATEQAKAFAGAMVSEAKQQGLGSRP
jgi:hypothetical protein